MIAWLLALLGRWLIGPGIDEKVAEMVLAIDEEAERFGVK